MPWDLTGNRGINPANNFLGTTDNQPLVIRTNGSERMRVTPGGNVGIGTAVTAPGTTLDVFRDVGDDVGGLHLTASGGRLLKIGVRADASNERAFIDYTRNNVGMPLILQMIGGNVGIGTTRPGTSLDVHRDVGDDVGGLHLTASGGRLLKIGVRADASNERAFIDYTRNNVGMPLILQMNRGNVGIGTLSPGEKLTVNGRVRSTTGGFVFPDGSVQTTATLRGPQGPAGPSGPQGPPGPAVRTSAVCVTSVTTCNLVCSGRVVAEAFADCVITADTGTCQNVTGRGVCCVCAP